MQRTKYTWKKDWAPIAFTYKGGWPPSAKSCGWPTAGWSQPSEESNVWDRGMSVKWRQQGAFNLSHTYRIQASSLNSEEGDLQEVQSNAEPKFSGGGLCQSHKRLSILDHTAKSKHCLSEVQGSAHQLTRVMEEWFKPGPCLFQAKAFNCTYDDW